MMMARRLSWVVALLVSSMVVVKAATPCALKQMKYGNVCVCNATYCDSIEEVGSLANHTVVQYTSSKNGDRMTRSELAFSKTSNSGWQNITLDLGSTFQTMKGFGAAFTDAAAINLYKMDPPVQELLLEQYFGADGTQYSTGRVPIASTDFSTSVYSYNEVVDDMALDHFSIDMDLTLKIPFIKRAMAKALSNERGLSLFASPWAPPAWMTAQNTTIKNPTLKGGPQGAYAKSWALYFAKFLDEYAKHNITFFGVTAQNEPAGNTGAWQDLKFSAADQRDFIKSALGPLLKFTHPSIDIIIMDDQRIHLPGWADTILGDADAAQYVNGIGVHWYASLEDSTPSALYWGKMKTTHQHHPNTYMLATEACEGYLPWSKGPQIGSWKRAETYAKDIMGDINAFAVGWTDWNLYLDLSGGPNWAGNVVDAPILLDVASKSQFFKNPMFYAMAHFSKFVLPGYKRVGVNSQAPFLNAPMETTAFISPDGKTVVVVVLNRDIASHNYFIQVSGKGFINVNNMAAHSMKTFVFEL